MSVLIDSATVASPADTNCDSSQLMGQSFEVQNDCDLDELIIDMKTNGSPSGSFQFQIYAHSGTYGSTSVPTGSVLATSDTVNVSSLTSSYATYSVYFTGGNKIAVTTGQRYVLVCNYATTSYPNSIFFKNKTPSFHGGNQSYKAGSWTALGSYDIIFELRGTVVTDVTVSGTVQSATFSIPAYTASTSISIAPSAQVATFSIPTYAVEAGDITVLPNLQACTFSIPTYTVDAGNVTILQAVFTATFTILPYEVRGDYWQGKFVQPSNTWNQKFTPPTNTWNPKY